MTQSVRFYLNDNARVRLTASGRKVAERYWEEARYGGDQFQFAQRS